MLTTGLIYDHLVYFVNSNKQTGYLIRALMRRCIRHH